MNTNGYEELWQRQIDQGWAQEQIKQQSQRKFKNKSKTQSMLSSLSNNLVTYENSYKKQKKLYSVRPQRCENLKKRRINKKKLNFQEIQENDQMKFVSNNQNKENRNQSVNKQHKKLESLDENKFKCKQSQKIPTLSNPTDNTIKLEHMFKVLKQFDNLNSTILPFKVNMNKISHKRIIANLIYKQFNSQKDHAIQETINKQLQTIRQKESKKQTLQNTEFVPLKRKVFSLDVRRQQDISKRKYNEKSLRHINNDSNNIFSLNFNKCSNTTFTKRKRSFSVRKTDYSTQKTIEEIRNNHTKLDRNYSKQNCVKYSLGKKNIKENSKQNQYFSDSRFFIKRQILGEIFNENSCFRK